LQIAFGTIEKVKLVGHVGLGDQRAHPASNANCVGLKIKGDGKAQLQDIDDVRGHRGAKPRGKAGVVVDCFQIAGEKIGRPMIFADEQRRRTCRQSTRKCRFPGSDPAADKVQSWAMSRVHK